jgi:hypothetical protein
MAIMRLNELFESESKHVTFCFGRMNPPTIGHKKLLDTCSSVGGDYKIFLSQTQDPKKNPLDYQTKIKFVKELFPNHANNIVDDAGLNTVVKVADYLYNIGYKNATFVAGSDRLDAMKQLLTQYNGVEGKAHGYYKFEVLDFKSSGDREDGAEGVAGISASNARVAAANNDLEAFKESTGAGQYADALFKAVRQGMGITEGVKTFNPDDFDDGLDSVISDLENQFKEYSTMYFIVDKNTGKKIRSLGPYDSLERAKEDQQEFSLVNTTKIVKRTNKGITGWNKNTDLEEGYGRYWCSTDKKWKTRKGPKQKRSS